MLTVSKTLLIAAALFGSTALVNAAPSDNIGAIKSYQYKAGDSYAQGSPVRGDRAGRAKTQAVNPDEEAMFERVKRLD